MPAKGIGGLLVGPPGAVGIDLEQDLRVDDLTDVGLALGDDLLELLALHRSESNDVPLVHGTPLSAAPCR